MRARFITSIFALTLIAAACGGGADTTTTESPTTESLATEPVVDDNVQAEGEDGTTESTRQGTTDSETDKTPTSMGGEVAAAASGTLSAFLATDTEAAVPTSGRFEATISMEPGPDAEFSDPLTMSFGGAFDEESNSSQVFIDFSAMGEALLAGVGEEEGAEEFAALFTSMFTEPMEVITIGEESWVKSGFFSLFLGADADKWIHGTSGTSDPTGGFGFGANPSDPTEFLSVLEDANADVEEIGTEDVRGEPTTHYRALLDLEELAGELSADERAELDEMVGSGVVPEFPLDIWIDGDGQLRKFSLSLDAAAMQDDSFELESASVTFELWDLGADIAIVAPPAEDVVEEDELGFDLGGFDLGG